MTERLVSLLIGYIFGLFQTSYIIGKMHKTDIREHGSGNGEPPMPLRAFGKKSPGAMTTWRLPEMCTGDTSSDFSKFCVRHLCRCLQSMRQQDVLGHNFPINLGFRGGKGIAASVGFLLALTGDCLFCVRLYSFAIFCPDTLCFSVFADCLSGCADRTDRCVVKMADME